mmetsp:Transcript_29495/g.80993  ORF Transcript_29495/g.80993 Transcript_29495/m.80993 type:complete len:84 (-) Transcript_29495:470-721(-)
MGHPTMALPLLPESTGTVRSHICTYALCVDGQRGRHMHTPSRFASAPEDPPNLTCCKLKWPVTLRLLLSRANGGPPEVLTLLL